MLTNKFTEMINAIAFINTVKNKMDKGNEILEKGI